MTVKQYRPLDEGQCMRKDDDRRSDHIPPLRKWLGFLGLIPTTLIVSFLVAGTNRKWTTSGRAYTTLIEYRSSVQIAVQLVSALLGFLEVSVVCRLINLATRIRLCKQGATLNAIYAWSSLSLPRVGWELPFAYLFPILIFVIAALIPSALWAGAITPVQTTKNVASQSPILIPRFRATENIIEFPSEIGSSGPDLRDARGYFTFSPGVKLQGSLLATAASATIVDGSPRQHSKLDNSHYTYHGRSFGIGASVGLQNEIINGSQSRNTPTSYTYSETGLRADVQCVFNSSAQFILGDSYPNYPMIFPAMGFLPNSGETEEHSDYIGHGSSDTIVAIGVAKNNQSTERVLGIAAGKNYEFLNATQCSVTFIPASFDVSVGLLDRSINVTESGAADAFPAMHNLTYVLLRQFELISNDQTSFYVSVLGDAFNASIASYSQSQLYDSSHSNSSPEKNTLAGLESSVTAMVDDLLVAYASAQFLIQDDSEPAAATVEIYAFEFGSRVYIYIIFAINTAIVLLVVEEAIRTRGWKDLTYFDYMDPRSLVIASSMGGSSVAQAIKDSQAKPLHEYEDERIGKTRVILDANRRAIVSQAENEGFFEMNKR